MNEQIKIGTRVLFTTGPGTPIEAGTVEEYSPSGRHIGLEVNRREAWYPLNLFSVVEELSVPPPETAAPALTLVPPEGADSGAPKTDGGNTGGTPPATN